MSNYKNYRKTSGFSYFTSTNKEGEDRGDSYRSCSSIGKKLYSDTKSTGLFENRMSPI